MSGLGDELRSAREARRLSLADVSEQIHIRSVYLQALEDENWSAISAPVYVRGFLRTYARFLGLNGDAAVERFSLAAGVPAIATPQPVPPSAIAPPKVTVQTAVAVEPLPKLPKPPKPRREAPRREPKATREGATDDGPSIYIWLSAALAVGLVLFVAYTYFQKSGEQSAYVTADATSAPRVAATRAATPAPTKAPDRTLALRVTQRSWIHVDIDGKPALEGIFDKGWAKEFHGDAASVSVGNAGGVDVRVNGQEKGAMGADGDVVEKRFPLAGEKDGRG